MTPEEIGAAIRAFRSENCPACRVIKRRQRDPFCDDCFGRLPIDLQEDVSNDSLFLDAFHPALTYLSSSRENLAPAAPKENENDS